MALAFLALALFPVVATDFYAQMAARMMILGIFAMSLDLLLGVTGLVSLGHAAFFGGANTDTGRSRSHFGPDVREQPCPSQ